jgi:hypothetical protein
MAGRLVRGYPALLLRVAGSCSQKIVAAIAIELKGIWSIMAKTSGVNSSKNFSAILNNEKIHY